MKHPKKSDAKRRAWQPGGAHRIAHEQRMQAKKTMVHRTSQPAANVIGQKAIGNSLLMYRAACLLLLTDAPHNRKQAESLLIAADHLLGDAQ